MKVAQWAAYICVAALWSQGPVTPAGADDNAPAAPFVVPDVAPVEPLQRAGHAPGAVAPGWPITVPGSVCGSPSVAKLHAGKVMAVLAPVMYLPQMHPNILSQTHDMAARIYAWNPDGIPVPNWPVTAVPAADREAYSPLDDLADVWFGSPTVFRIKPQETDSIATTLPSHGHRGLVLFQSDGSPWPVAIPRQMPDCWISAPAADIDGDGIPDFVSGSLLVNALGNDLKTWSHERSYQGYQACIGDARNDGLKEVFIPPYEKDWEVFGQPDDHNLRGFDRKGRPLPGWPQKVWFIGIYPVMGDISGDKQKEIMEVDQVGLLHAWTIDGAGVPGSKDMGANGRGVVRTGMGFAQKLALADVDGDGKAEILFWDWRARAIRAIKGDGKGVGSADGLVATLPNLQSSGEMAVANLGKGGFTDIFIGTYWVRWKPGKAAQVWNLIDEDAAITAAPSVADLRGDGKAEVVFGSMDGRIWVYDTGMPLTGKQWVTTAGNFQHTGCWTDPAPAPNVP